MKKRIWVLAAAAALALTGCGGSSQTDYASSADSVYDSAQGFSTYELKTEEYEIAEADYDLDYEAGGTNAYSQKLIRSYYYSFETTEFDASVSYITGKVAEYGGYIESSETSGSSKRYAYFTIRIPETAADGFLSEVGSIGTITYQSSSSEDITLEYYDVTARLESLNAQHERLLELMEQAASLDDIVALEESLADVEYEINSYTTTLQVYDNLVDYVTIDMSLNEVTQIQVVEEDTVWTQIRKGFSSNTSAVVGGLVDLFVFLVTAVPYLIVLAVIVLVVYLICRAIAKSHRKKAKKRAQYAQQPYAQQPEVRQDAAQNGPQGTQSEIRQDK